MLDAPAAVDLLVEHELLSAKQLTRQSVVIREASRRNFNLRVEVANGRSFFIKQPDSSQVAANDSWQVEFDFYQQVQAAGAIAPVISLVPALVLALGEPRVLIIELSDLSPLTGFYGAPEKLVDYGIADALGRMLATLHAISAPSLAATWTDARPPVYDVARPGPDVFRTATSGHLAMIGFMQESRADALLARLADDWRPSSLTHGDFKWDNVLSSAVASPDAARVQLVDWELASHGDPGWDLGSAFHEYLVDAVRMTQPSAQASIDAIVDAFGSVVPRYFDATRTTWSAYLDQLRLAPDIGSARLASAVRNCGARLIQSAMEWSMGTATIPNEAVCFFQLGLNILERPEEAREYLLGLES